MGIELNTQFDIVRCENCGFVYINPKLKEEYNKIYYNQGKVKKYEFDKSDNSKSYDKNRILLKLLSLGEKQNYKTFLDYGSGFGNSMIVDQVLGYETYGVDIDSYRIEYCKKMD